MQRYSNLLFLFLVFSFNCYAEKTVNIPPPTTNNNYNIIFISFTNLRYDHLSINNYYRKTSPNIDNFCSKSLVFKNAFSHASWTLPVAMSLYTSTYPFSHQIMDRYTKNADKIKKGILNPQLDTNILTLVDVLKKNGYYTASFNGNQDYNTVFGLTSRFDYNKTFRYASENNTAVHDDNLPVVHDWKKYGSIKSIAPAALKWLEFNKNRKFFMHIQAYDLHCPFAVPELNTMFDPDYQSSIDFCDCYYTFGPTKPISITKNGITQKYYSLKSNYKDGKNFETKLSQREVEYMTALYDGEIFNVDLWFGKIITALQEMKLLENTIIVLFSEHGDMLGKHGRFMRGGPLRGTFYDDVLHIPLIIYHPEYQQKNIEELVQIIDLAPTLLNFLGIPIPKSFKGLPLKPLIIQNTKVNDYVFAGSTYTPVADSVYFNLPSKITSIRDENWKLIVEQIYRETKAEISYKLFNIQNDPQELTNIETNNPDVLLKYKTILENWEKTFNFNVLSKINSIYGVNEKPQDKEKKEKLKKLNKLYKNTDFIDNLLKKKNLKK